MILIDNATSITSRTLAAALTASTWRGRLLGRSEMAIVPNEATWAATGNNLSLSIEIGRRVVPIRLDAGVEHPEERTGFRHALPAWAYAHRVELVTALLSLVRAWQAAGMPAATATLGRYESWVQIVGGIVTHAGFGGFLENRAARVATADRESAEWAVFCRAWWDRYREQPMTAGELLRLAAEQQVLLDLFVGRPQLGGMQRLGRALSARRDNVVAESDHPGVRPRCGDGEPELSAGTAHVAGARRPPVSARKTPPQNT